MTRSNIQLGGQELKLDADGDSSITVDTDDKIDIKVGGTDSVIIDSSGRVTVGQVGTDTTISGGQPAFQVTGAAFDGYAAIVRRDNGQYGSGIVLAKSRNTTADSFTIVQSGDALGSIVFIGDDGTNLDTYGAVISAEVDGSPGANDLPTRLTFSTTPDGSATPAERMRIKSTGAVLIGTTSDLIYDDTSGDGGIVFNYGDANYIQAKRSSGGLMYLNRISDDGPLIVFYQDGNSEGNISVSGSTVSYNGFSGLHKSSGIATDTPVGTVVSTIDELDVYSAKQGEAGEETNSTKAGQTRADHAKVEVSNTVGDKTVYGVVANFNAQGKVNVASVGIGSVRVTGACAKGDLLESNGDGTAKVQSDDIVRSKTIGKVTIGNSSTDVKLVSCVLYCG